MIALYRSRSRLGKASTSRPDSSFLVAQEDETTFFNDSKYLSAVVTQAAAASSRLPVTIISLLVHLVGQWTTVIEYRPFAIVPMVKPISSRRLNNSRDSIVPVVISLLYGEK